MRNTTYHERRMNDTRTHFWPESPALQLAGYLPAIPGSGVHKLRIVYGQNGIEEVTCTPYTLRPVRSLALIQADDIDYACKSTDRITALIAELRKLGYAVRSEQDSILLWEGERCPAESAPVIATYEDHRMAMAFAPACIALPQIRIDEPQVVSKSYPGYWEDLKQAGFTICH